MNNPQDRVGIPWLFDELGELRRQNILSSEASAALENHYRPKALIEKHASYNRMHLYLTTLLAILATLLIAGGIILLFCNNWDKISREMRTVVAIVPVLIGLGLAAWTLACEKSRPWREFTGIWLMLSVSYCFGTINQIYHISGKFSDSMLILTLTTLFVPVLLRSLSANIIQLTYFAAWTAAAIDPETFMRADISRPIYHDILICVGLLLALVPYYFVTKEKKHFWERLVDSIVLVLAMYEIASLFFIRVIPDYPHVFALLILAIACAQLMIGHWIKHYGDPRAAKPWHVGGWIGIVVLVIPLSSNALHLLVADEIYSWWLIPVILLVAYAAWRTIRMEWFVTMLGLLPVFVFLIMMYVGHQREAASLHHSASDTKEILSPFQIAPLLMTLTFVLFSVSSAIYGYWKRDGGIFTGSFFVLTFALAVRFFDWEYSLLTRSLVFLSIGLLVLTITFITSRIFQKELPSGPLPVLPELIE